MSNDNKDILFEDEEINDLFLGEDKKSDEEKSEKNSFLPDVSGSQTQEEEFAKLPKSKIVLIKKLLANIAENSEKVSQMIAPFLSEEDEARIKIGQLDLKTELDDVPEGTRIIEGVFDGENMIGPDGKQYTVPANYASKSKLVEGDILKLTITPKGAFVYKQIGPIDRLRIVGVLEKGGEGDFHVVSDGKRWRVLTASVTYYKGEAGDEAVILVPKNGDSKWAAVENVVRKFE